MEITSFKERVKNAAIANAPIYEKNFVKYDYLVCSKAYSHDYHIIKADRSNYLHLIGIHTNLTAEQFFEKCTATDEHQLKETEKLRNSDMPYMMIFSFLKLPVISIKLFSMRKTVKLNFAAL